MPRVKNIDSFIESATDLLTAYPTTTTLSITYSNVEKKQSKEGKVVKDSKHNRASHLVSTKLFEPASGKCIKYSTFKIKELSKILTFIGPKGVNVITKHKDVEQGHEVEESVHKIGLASIMTNAKFEDVVEPEVIKETEKESTPVVETSAPKKKNKKKKGKK